MTNLSDIYKKSLQIESEIIKFIDLCNKYLENKMFSYDKENLTFDIKILCTRQKISTNQFSWVWGLKN